LYAYHVDDPLFWYMTNAISRQHGEHTVADGQMENPLWMPPTFTRMWVAYARFWNLERLLMWVGV